MLVDEQVRDERRLARRGDDEVLLSDQGGMRYGEKGSELSIVIIHRLHAE